ncbi:MAG: DHHA1 domain-containing protein, partial [Rickettsia endosymbiont of Stiretrus anchorago]|nr:DHHA1 domain-containing protein [Rickettsia endosymbiont of Stiretrus anchorago]
KAEDLVVVYVGNNSSKLSITVAISKAITDRFNAGFIAKELSLFLGGSGGGGQPSIAQAGGNDLAKLPKVKDQLQSLLDI